MWIEFYHQRVLLVEYFTSQAVKQDIVRSLASRLELHWDSLIEEEHGSPEGILIGMCNPE